LEFSDEKIQRYGQRRGALKKIIILGTGFGQKPLVDIAKKLNIFSIGIDIDRNSQCSQDVDRFYEVDIKDTSHVLRIAMQEKVDAIMTMQSDLPVPVIGRVNDELKLKGVTFNTAEICSNKDRFRQALKDTNCKQPSFQIVKSEEEAIKSVNKIGLPCVIKAPDSSGSRGIVKVNKICEVSQAFKEACSYSVSKNIVVEEFIDGIEIGAQTFSKDGKCLNCYLHNDFLSESGYMVPNGHSYPLKGNFNAKKIKREVEKALMAIKLFDGPSNIDLIINNEGEVFVIEIGARIGATCLPELTEVYSGRSLEERMIKLFLGYDEEPFPHLEKPCAAFILESKEDGVLRNIECNFDISDYKKYKPQLEITAKIGQKISILKKGTDRLGKIMVSADNVDIAESIALEIKSKIKFEVE
jgi:biotin carboxylase